MTLYEWIREAQCGNEVAMLALIEQFDPLLQKYTAKLDIEDAYSDLTADFIGLMRNIKLDKLRIREDGGIVNYISKSMYHSYIARSKSDARTLHATPFSRLNEADLDFAERATATTDTYLHQHIDKPKLLTAKEADVLLKLYVDELTVLEIAQEFNTSRQNINQTKNRALEKLRNIGYAA